MTTPLSRSNVVGHSCEVPARGKRDLQLQNGVV